MPITFHSEKKIFKLDTSTSSYIFKIGEGGYVMGLYWGEKLDEADVDYLTVREGHDSNVPLSASVPDWRFSPDTMQAEYPAYGTGDFRLPAVMIKNAAGNCVTDCRYGGHRISRGKKPIPGIPSTYASDDEAETLELFCRDVTGAEFTLVYTVFEDFPVMTRHAVVKNGSDTPIWVEKAASMCVDFTHPAGFELLHLWGCWARERRVERRPLGHGITKISSGRGASGHYHNPFAALVLPGTDEEHGDAYGFNLVYSGNFAIEAEVDAFGLTRVVCGINEDGFSWKLAPGEKFYTPEVVMTYSNSGLGGMSRAQHRFYRRHLLEKKWLASPRPVVVNNWEATYFDFDADKLVDIARDAGALGFDMLVVDDGWFGKRNDDSCSLGDWVVNEEKLPGGMGKLAERIGEFGMGLGLWFEPEMASRDSDLYRAHPDWCIHTEGRDMSIARRQYVLDLSREDVCDYIVDALTSVLSSADIKYVKWDFNRKLTEYSSAVLPADRQGELFHRYILGLYSVVGRIKERFPDVLLEGCASGGGRYDPAMLALFPQYWTSDDTDPIERLYIQYGTSMAYPACTMSCHVSASPNHQTGRKTPFSTRCDVAAAGVFGYELDPRALSEREREETKRRVAEYKARRHIVTDGDLYRLIPPDGDECAWMYVTKDKSEALFTYVRIKTMIAPVAFVRLRGLDPDRTYVDGDGRRYLGSTLMRAGLNLTGGRRDAESVTVYFKAE